jgi:phage terminase small subunit
MTIEPIDDADFGPAMRTLSPLMRRFVQVMVENPGCNRSAAAAEAGYSAVSAVSLRVTVHRLMHDGRVLTALDELTTQRLQSATLMATAELERIISSEGTTAKDRLKAIGMVLDRTGHAAAQTINVNKTVTRKVDASEAMARIAEFRQKFPQQFAKLTGAAPEVIEGEFAEVVK